MRALVLLPLLAAAVSALYPYGYGGYGYAGHGYAGYGYGAPYALHGAPYAYAVPTVRTAQHHAQDELGQYTYGYSGGPSAKTEMKDAYGITRGSYSYIDANGITQTANYVADALGFRVAASNLPVAPAAAPFDLLPQPKPVTKTAEVLAAEAAHFAAHAEAKAALRKKRQAIFGGYGLPYSGYAGYAGYAAPRTSQFHAQDELGQYKFGYTGGPSAKTEMRDAYGITRGGYTYIDANGIPQTVNYVADALGFRVAATNLPRANLAAPVNTLVGPLPVNDTPEVMAAKAAHAKAHADALAAASA